MTTPPIHTSPIHCDDCPGTGRCDGGERTPCGRDINARLAPVHELAYPIPVVTAVEITAARMRPSPELDAAELRGLSRTAIGVDTGLMRAARMRDTGEEVAARVDGPGDDVALALAAMILRNAVGNPGAWPRTDLLTVGRQAHALGARPSRAIGNAQDELAQHPPGAWGESVVRHLDTARAPAKQPGVYYSIGGSNERNAVAMLAAARGSVALSDQDRAGLERARQRCDDPRRGSKLDDGDLFAVRVITRLLANATTPEGEPPPGILHSGSVSMCLSDPRVRAGTHLIDAYDTIGCRLRCGNGTWVFADDGLGWRRWNPCADDLDRAGRIVPMTPRDLEVVL